MNFKIHPVLKQLSDLGCSDQRSPAVVFAVHMDLAEVRAVWDLSYEFCKELDLIYLLGKENESAVEPDVYIPLPASKTISPEWLQKVQSTLPTNGKGVTIAVKDADSTIVYYHISEGLVAPDSPDVVQNKKSIEEKKKLMLTELWRKRDSVLDTAKTNFNSEKDDNST